MTVQVGMRMGLGEERGVGRRYSCVRLLVCESQGFVPHQHCHLYDSNLDGIIPTELEKLMQLTILYANPSTPTLLMRSAALQ